MRVAYRTCLWFVNSLACALKFRSKATPERTRAEVGRPPSGIQLESEQYGDGGKTVEMIAVDRAGETGLYFE
jgi:hypothetical protein